MYILLLSKDFCTIISRRWYYPHYLIIKVNYNLWDYL